MSDDENDRAGGELNPDTVREVLNHGEISVTGRLSGASNLTLLATVSADGVDIDCVYKPVRGERPLWDFPDGTLAGREVAAYAVSEYAGWNCVPLTILRPGPFGEGMVQQWIDTPLGETDADFAGVDLVDVLPIRSIPKGWMPVFRAYDETGDDVAVVHADDPALAVLAGFDVAVNNADRKGAHVLAPGDGRVLGVDHGLTFHTDPKLRTILWGWAGKPLPEAVVEGLTALRAGMSGDLETRLEELLTISELVVFAERIDKMLRRPVFPHPPKNRHPIPWPPL